MWAALPFPLGHLLRQLADAPEAQAHGAALFPGLAQQVDGLGGGEQALGGEEQGGGTALGGSVEEAGGALPDADLDMLNLARPLVDGEQVLVGVPSSAGDSGTDPQGVAGEKVTP